jgi:tRNA(Ile2) C34 agmatinyltransferase TiaS
MRKTDPSPPTCPRCKTPMKFMLAPLGGREFRCAHCNRTDPMTSPVTLGWLRGELGKGQQYSSRATRASIVSSLFSR